MKAEQKAQAAVDAVCPNHGISFGRLNDKTTWRVQVKDEATAQQRAAAQAAIDAFDIAAATAPPTPEEIEAEVVALLNGGDGPRIDLRKLIKAKFVSDLAHRLGKAPGQLTGPELTGERNRIAAIYKAL